MSHDDNALRCYDNGGTTLDRYTIVPPEWAHEYRERPHSRVFSAIVASAQPYAPQGIGQHSAVVPGRHLGRRIRWRDLPANVQRLARESFPEFVR